jgi:hypothetical protein
MYLENRYKGGDSMFRLNFSHRGLESLQTPADDVDAGELARRYEFLSRIAEPLQKLDDEIRKIRKIRNIETLKFQ